MVSILDGLEGLKGLKGLGESDRLEGLEISLVSGGSFYSFSLSLLVFSSIILVSTLFLNFSLCRL